MSHVPYTANQDSWGPATILSQFERCVVWFSADQSRRCYAQL
jgi:hypothetical protein